MKFQLLSQVFAGVILLIVSSVNSDETTKNVEEEKFGRQNNQFGVHGKDMKKPDSILHQPKRNDLIKESRLRGQHGKQNKPEENFKSPEGNSRYHSPERDSEMRLEQAIEYTDRKTLLEWYDYGTSIKGLIDDVEREAKKCGCSVIYEPLDDSKRRINHSLVAVSKKLRYGSVSAPKPAKT